MKLSQVLVSQALLSALAFGCSPRPIHVSMAANSSKVLDVDGEGRHGPDPESISPDAIMRSDAGIQLPDGATAEDKPGVVTGNNNSGDADASTPAVNAPAADNKPGTPAPAPKPGTPAPAPAPAPKPATPAAAPVPAPKPGAPAPAPVPVPKPATPASAPAPAPKPAPQPAPAPAPAPAGGNDYQAMLKAGEVISTYTVTNAQGWGTSPANRIEVAVAVDNAGKAMMIARPANTQVVSSVDGSKKEGNFGGTGTHSALRICNKSNKAIFLHSGTGGAPFDHGQGPIAIGACAKFLVRNANTPRDGASYDRAAGGAKENFVYFKIKKIKPDGTEMK